MLFAHGKFLEKKIVIKCMHPGVPRKQYLIKIYTIDQKTPRIKDNDLLISRILTLILEYNNTFYEFTQDNKSTSLHFCV